MGGALVRETNHCVTSLPHATRSFVVVQVRVAAYRSEPDAPLLISCTHTIHTSRHPDGHSSSLAEF